MNKKALLKLDHVSLTYPDGTFVLESINISVYKGEFVSLIGPSGCGKTSLFQCISGLLEPSSGSISFPRSHSSSRIGKFGYSLQKPLLLPNRTVIENVLLGLEVRSADKKQSLQKAHEVLRHFDLSEFENYYPHALSGGMQQRVALLRTILFRSDFLLLDEPFGALDALTRMSSQSWLMRVWEAYHSTVLFITHDISEAILLSDIVFVLSKRPAKIIKKIQIPFKRPRKREMLLTLKGSELGKKVLQSILTQTNE